MNGCPCGFLGDPQKECVCTLPQVHRYRTKVSGPLLDRIDIQVEVPAVSYRDLADQTVGESSESIRARVDRARRWQLERFDSPILYCNAQMAARDLRRHCAVERAAEELLEQAMTVLGLSARAYTRILKVARTIIDLDVEERIQKKHLGEAIQYRILDRGQI